MLERFEGGVPGVKIWWWDLWRQVLIDYYHRYNSSAGIVRDSNAYADVQALYSGRDRISVFYTLDEFPETMTVRYAETIRNSLAEAVYVRISFATLMERYSTPWNSAKIKSKIRTWSTIAEEDESTGSAYTAVKESDQQARISRREASLYYMANAEQRRGRRSFRFRVLMIVSGVRGPEFDKGLSKVEKVCSDLGIRATRVTENLDRYIAYFSPFRLASDSSLAKGIGSTVLTDEILARFNNYTQGQVGRGPIYWGTDIYSGYPVWNEIKKKDTDAENILVVAETGGGKSFFVKTILLGILADKRFDATIMDIEGFEYAPLVDIIGKSDKCVQLNMAEGKGAYFDPVAVYQTGDPVLDEDMYTTSRSYTISVLKTLMGDYSKDNQWVDTIINDVVSKTYLKAGVTEDPSTWANSHNLTLKDVYKTILDLYKSDNIEGVNKLYANNTGYLDAKDRVIAQLSRYFDKNGTRANVFSHPVGIDTIKDARVVICSFGLAGKTEKTIDPIQLALTQLFAANIAGLRSRFGQLRGQYSLKLWEEFQRWSSLPDSEKTIVTALTGGRKLGDVNIIITNKVSDLLNGDRFGIFETATSFAIGSIQDSKVRHELAKRLNVERLIPDLDSLVIDSNNKVNNERYRYAFVVHPTKGIETVTKMDLPPSITESPLFRTGIKRKDETADTVSSLDKALSEIQKMGIDLGGTGLLDMDE